jgi:hypothetical protein
MRGQQQRAFPWLGAFPLLAIYQITTAPVALMLTTTFFHSNFYEEILANINMVTDASSMLMTRLMVAKRRETALLMTFND